MEDKEREKEKESKNQSSFIVAISNTPDQYKCVRWNLRRNWNVTLKKAYLQFNHTFWRSTPSVRHLKLQRPPWVN